MDAQSHPTLCDPMDCSPWTTKAPQSMDFSGKNTGAGCHFLLQGIFLTQESTHICCSHALVGRLFATESPGKPQTSSTDTEIRISYDFSCIMKYSFDLFSLLYKCKKHPILVSDNTTECGQDCAHKS